LNYSCPGCGQQIAGSYIPDGPRKWHPACHQAAFPPLPGCAECRKPFTANELAYEVNGKKLCYACSQFAVNFACAGCGQVIKDAYIPLDNLKYHSACFNKLVSFEHSSTPYNLHHLTSIPGSKATFCVQVAKFLLERRLTLRSMASAFAMAVGKGSTPVLSVVEN